MKDGWKEHWKPRVAWLAIGAFVVAYDALCPKGETLSEEVYRQRESKLGRFVIDKLMTDVVEHLQGEQNWINDIAKLSPKSPKPTRDGSDRFDVFGTDD